jgi:hypothetical protein
MKHLLKIAGVIGVLLGILSQTAVPKNYTEKVKTGGEIESRYLQMGSSDVSYMESSTLQSYKKYEIWYPSEIEAETGNRKYPAVVFVNGTGVKASEYKALFAHLASWGFICIGTEEEYAWNGFSAEMCVRTLLKLNENETVEGYNNVFYQKIDTANIGITGHSQGGAGVINAITDTKHAAVYKTAVAISPANEELSAALDWSYDATNVNIPMLLLSGTGKADENLVVNLQQLESIYQHISGSAIKVMARRSDADHGDMLYFADGYVTAWFMWQLQGDSEAAKAFVGDDPELLRNALYQDQKIEGNAA